MKSQLAQLPTLICNALEQEWRYIAVTTLRDVRQTDRTNVTVHRERDFSIRLPSRSSFAIAPDQMEAALRTLHAERDQRRSDMVLLLASRLGRVASCEEYAANRVLAVAQTLQRDMMGALRLRIPQSAERRIELARGVERAALDAVDAEEARARTENPRIILQRIFDRVSLSAAERARALALAAARPLALQSVHDSAQGVLHTLLDCTSNEIPSLQALLYRDDVTQLLAEAQASMDERARARARARQHARQAAAAEVARVEQALEREMGAAVDGGARALASAARAALESCDRETAEDRRGAQELAAELQRLGPASAAAADALVRAYQLRCANSARAVIVKLQGNNGH